MIFSKFSPMLTHFFRKSDGMFFFGFQSKLLCKNIRSWLPDNGIATERTRRIEWWRFRTDSEAQKLQNRIQKFARSNFGADWTIIWKVILIFLFFKFSLISLEISDKWISLTITFDFLLYFNVGGRIKK